jgi:hypothetical protein
VKNIVAIAILSVLVSPVAAFAQDAKSPNSAPETLREGAIRETIRLASNKAR